MASRQVNFYILPDDQVWLEQVIRSAGPFLIMGRVIKNGEPILRTSTVVERFGVEELTIYLLRKADVERLVTYAVPNSTDLFIDVLRSPVIEFGRCYFDGKLLRSGRLYVIDSYYTDDGQRAYKDTEFVEWARKVIAVVRKSLELRKDGDYASENAIRAENQQGLVLTDH